MRNLVSTMALRLPLLRHLKEDLEQDIWGRAVRYYPTFRHDCSEHSWLYIMGMHWGYQYYRHHYLHREIADERFFNTESAFHPTIRPGFDQQIEDRNFLLTHIEAANLKEEMRTILLLRIDGLEPQEIAILTGLTKGAVKTYVSRGLDRIAKHLGLHRERLGGMRPRRTGTMRLRDMAMMKRFVDGLTPGPATSVNATSANPLS